MGKIAVLPQQIKRFFVKIIKINDTPQRVALGFGLGVSLGILPGSGPIASIVLSSLFRWNRASALLGSLATNTWLSVVTFLISLKAGAFLLGLDWKRVYAQWLDFAKDLRWQDSGEILFLKSVFPVLLGYAVIALFLGFVSYLACLLALKFLKYRRQPAG